MKTDIIKAILSSQCYTGGCKVSQLIKYINLTVALVEKLKKPAADTFMSWLI